MRQAILVMNNGGFDTLQQTINLLDDKDIDFYIYAKDDGSLTSKSSKLNFVGCNKKVHAQTFAELVEEKLLINQALKGDYEYFHLISSNDFPLMTKRYFKDYFASKPVKLGFVEFSDSQDQHSLAFYYPFNNFNYQRVWTAFPFVKVCMLLNHLLGVERISSDDVVKGCPYFSLPREYVTELDEQKIDNYRHTINPKNFFAQTVLKNLKTNNPEYTMNSNRFNLMKAYGDSARYANYVKTKKINWFDENAYQFSDDDKDELGKVVNADYAFAHNVTDGDDLASLLKD
ncbi:hypothetical protein HW41_06520 [Apilactobacillus kunkeei]|uniref:hypothetical protein n=1 Tax=Apilactobacillus kunkeei TaxID=148814 RepID=UPI00059B4918|nr:hypothetical protein [Apilactobacillus kunkeei]KIM18154.1 hypothetical protein HW41_06520 [Apilactobacillus kunkeei]